MPAPVAVGLLLAATSLPAAAASFDCAKAASPIERAICADPKLSAADGALGEAFAKARARLSPAGQQALTQDQRAWLRYRDDYCRIAAKPLPECLTQVYGPRVAELQQDVRDLGGYRVMTLHAYAAHPEAQPDPGSDFSKPVEAETSWDQIDGAATDLATAVNQRLRDLAHADRPPDFDQDDDTDVDRSVTLEAVGADLVSIAVESGTYGHGAAHPLSAFEQHSVLPALKREVTPADLFRSGADWSQALARLVAAKLTADLGPSDDTFKHEPADLLDAVKDPTRWILGPDTLTVRFQQYEVAPYAAGMPLAAIPWRDLAAVLNPQSPYPPAKAAAR